MKHNHDLDGKLHHGCGACDYIVEVNPKAVREAKADALAKHYATKAKKEKKRK